MKVINQWDSPEEPTMNSRCADCRCARPPMPAAGPWRTDVENAPRDGSEVLLAWGSEKLGVSVFHWDKENDVWSDGSDGYVEHEYIRAFAAINRPEIDNA